MNVLQKYADFLRFTYKMPFDFSKHGTIGAGGFSPLALFPENEAQMLEILSLLHQKQLPYCIVGNLSNTLAADGAIRRIVVCTKYMKYTRISGKYLYVEAGINSGRLLQRCINAGLSGVEFLEGIPCTLGGALYMNAGVNGAHMSDVVESVRVYRDGQVQTLTLQVCEYDYKTSAFMRNNNVILGATLRLTSATPSFVQEQISIYKSRRLHLPKGKSLGCIFKNPKDRLAGQLIDGAGLKGMRIGGAVVSNEHANFIINERNATAQDIRTLIMLIKNAVFAQYKIVLEEEIRYLES